jgi:hypothetical protein
LGKAPLSALPASPQSDLARNLENAALKQKDIAKATGYSES